MPRQHRFDAELRERQIGHACELLTRHNQTIERLARPATEPFYTNGPQMLLAAAT
ncbi:hypothetical protein ACQR16_23905 [Bradyrhizobium oligotrophicum]|uniref:hypothetical protein n=1 Tax=Bradyrhizobium oligotrophicum TaxID=44255 RepID=UPI003EB92789